MKTFPTGRSLSAFFLAGALAAPALFLPASARGDWVLRFDGVDDFVSAAPVPLDTRVTVTAWIYTENPITGTGYGHVAGQGNFRAGTAAGYGIYTDHGYSDNVVFQANHAAGGTEWTWTSQTKKQWHFVTARFSNASESCDLLLDGVWANYWQNNNSSGAPWDLPQSWQTGADPFMIGCATNTAGANQPFRGCIAEVAVWNRFLETSEVAALKNHRLRGDEEGLVAYWPLDDGGGAVARNAAFGADAVGTDGTLDGATWEWREDLALPTAEEWAGTSVRSETTPWSISFATNGMARAFVRKPGATAAAEVALDAGGEGTLRGVAPATTYEAWTENAAGTVASPVERFRTPPLAADLPAWVLALDGADDVVSMGSDFAFTNAFTLATWYRRDFETASGGTWGVIAGMGPFNRTTGGSMTGFALYTDGTTPVAQARQTGVANSVWANGDWDDASQGNWHFGVERFDVENQRCDFFVDGVYRRSVGNGSGWNNDFHAPWRTDDVPVPFALGARYDPSVPAFDKFFQGAVAEVSLWNRVLSEAEIRALKTARPTGDEEGLVGYWSVTDGPYGAGTAVRDFMAGGRAAHDGTASGGTWARDASFPFASLDAERGAASAADAAFDGDDLSATVSSAIDGDWEIWAVWDATDRGADAAIDWASGPVACGSFTGTNGTAAIADVPAAAHVLRFVLVREDAEDAVFWTDPIDLTLVPRTGVPEPVAALVDFDAGASHAQFDFSLSALGDGAQSATATLTLSPAAPGGAVERSFDAAPVSFEIKVPGLTPATTYTWTLVVENDQTETTTLSGSFTTDAAPASPAAPVVSATGLSVDAAGIAAVGWDLAWPGTGADTAALSLVWGLEPGPMDRTNALEAAAIGTGTTLSALTALAPGRDYVARLVARNPATGATASAPEALAFSTAADYGTSSAGGTGRGVHVAAANFANGTEASFDLVFDCAPVHRTYTLKRASGPSDAGTDIAAWPVVDDIADVDPDDAGLAAVPVPAGWGTTAHAVRFFLVADAEEAPFDSRLEYLDSANAPYVDTGIVPADGMVYDFRFAWLSNDRQWGRAFGSYISENHNATRIIMNNNNVGALNVNYISRAGASQAVLSTVTQLGDPIEGVLSNGTIVLNGTTNTFFSPSGTTDDSTITLMGGSTGGNAVRFWRFGMTQDGARRMTLVPVVKDGAVGFHDAVTGTFFGPTGGSLTAGPALETTGFEDVSSWSETVLRTDPLAPAFEPGLVCTPTGVFDNGIVSGAMASVGAGGCSFVAEISPTADFSSFTSIPAGAKGEPGPFELRLHLRQGSSQSFLVPLSTGYVRVRASSSGRTALSDVASFTVPELPPPGTFIMVK